MKKTVHVFVIFLFTFSIVNALKITEVQFDPSGTDTDREWAEVLNDGASVIDFSKYKFFEANVNHSITALSTATLESGEYAVVIQDAAKFFTDYPNFTGKAFTSSFSLSNTGEALAFKTSGGATADSYTYSPGTTGSGNGLSEQLVSGSWTKGTPSPGLANVASVASSTESIETTTATTTTTTTTSSTTVVTATVTETIEVPKIVYVPKSYWPTSEKIYVSAGSNKMTVTGAEVQFEGKVFDPESKQQLTTGDFHWSFGDGYELSGSRGAKHIYRFPGEYTAVFQASSDGRSEEDRVYVKVVNPEVSLKLGRDNNLDYVEITNNYNEELKLDDFVLTQLDQNGLVVKSFTLPKGFSVLPKRSIKIDLELTKFTGPVVAVGLNYSSGIQLAKADNPNLLKDLKDIQTATATNRSISGVFVTLPGEVLPETINSSSVSTSTVTQATTTNLSTKTVKRKVSNSYKTQVTSPAAISTVQNTSIESSSTKTVLSKPKVGFWQSVKDIFGI